MPGILFTFLLLLISVLTAWFNRKAGITLFFLFLIVMGLVFLHHATDHLGLHF
ncbi:DUF5993 family protein [Caedibacter taeniospiralis]|uniref:DUF5993 family protein n=1 Tax=Caedibacter taeniospiralis TaxID=28907 RepID=UPI001E407301|nr:DUF5993 family protein [Caedibacter taeniospiralis]